MVTTGETDQQKRGKSSKKLKGKQNSMLFSNPGQLYSAHNRVINGELASK